MTALPCRAFSPALFLTVAGLCCLSDGPQPAAAAQPAGQAQSDSADPSTDSAGELVYFGTYSRGKSEGIYVSRFNPQTGQLGQPRLAAKTQHPSFLALHPAGGLLYAVNEISRMEDKSGLVTAFQIDGKTGLLTELNSAPSAGAHPCHLVVDSAGRNLLVANYTGGNVAVLPLAEDGRLTGDVHPVQHHGSSINPNRQKEPHAHSINLDASGRYAVAADLGIDQLLVYRFNPRQGKLESAGSARVKAGGGPRHFTFHPNGRFAYVINELDSTVTAFSWDADSGRLKNLQTVATLPAEFNGRNSTAEIRVHPSGRFLYGSNRGHHSLAIFRINQQTGELTPAGHHSSGGSTPRNF
ncbi:MAG: lactonase family protein, partial [Planctomycetaceae bacterium]|nr:lactonase family protein [Planctomycetaceae bacterium]